MNKFKLTPAFQEIFCTVICFTLLSGGASFWLAGKDNLSPQQNRVLRLVILLGIWVLVRFLDY